MTEAEITEIFIKAMEVMRKLPDTASPKTLKAMSLGYVHTFADMNGWHEEDKHAANWAWLDPAKLRASRNDIGLYEVSMELIKLCPQEKNRRALWAWATSKAGGMSLTKWARSVEHVHPETASRRAKAAISQIALAFRSKSLLHNDNACFEVLPVDPEISHKTSNIEVWRPEESKPLRCFFDTDIAGLDWAAEQSAKRRVREASQAA